MSSSNEERDAEVTIMNVTSPISSTISTSSSDSELSEAPETAADVFNPEEGEKELPLIPEPITAKQNNLVHFQRDLQESPRSTSPLEIDEEDEEEEEKGSEFEYSLSQRVYCSPSCKISVGLQQQCSQLWGQFDSIGTEMIVTRRGR